VHFLRTSNHLTLSSCAVLLVACIPLLKEEGVFFCQAHWERLEVLNVVAKVLEPRSSFQLPRALARGKVSVKYGFAKGNISRSACDLANGCAFRPGNHLTLSSCAVLLVACIPLLKEEGVFFCQAHWERLEVLNVVAKVLEPRSSFQLPRALARGKVSVKYGFAKGKISRSAAHLANGCEFRPGNHLTLSSCAVLLIACIPLLKEEGVFFCQVR
jgi:hypothetical protein